MVTEAQFMGTVVAIAYAIDVLWLAQQAQAAAETRIAQIENEKERLVWDSGTDDPPPLTSSHFL